MWVPKMKYIAGLFALKGIFKLPDGSDYEGPYHQDETGTFKTGDYPTENSVTIVEDPNELTEEQQAQEEFFSSFNILPTPKDYKRGFIIRYFLKDTTTNKIIEADKNFYEGKINVLYIERLSIKWIIDKPLKDIFNQGYVYKGTISRNKESVMKATLIMKGIDSYITNFSKFADIESDVEGYTFEELSEKEQIRIIKAQPSNLQRKPLKKVKSRLPYKKEPTPVPGNNDISNNPPSSGGGGGGGYGSIQEEEIFGGPQENVPGGGSVFGGGGSSSPSQGNYY